MTEPLDLDRLEALCREATPGPWAKAHDARYGSKTGAVVSPQGEAELGNWWVATCQWDADLAFIATSRTALPALLAEVRRVWAQPETKREALAEYAHEAWSGWMKYQFSKAPLNEDGSWTMPAWAVERWQRQMNTPYTALPESEKASDRDEADKMLAILLGVA